MTTITDRKPTHYSTITYACLLHFVYLIETYWFILAQPKKWQPSLKMAVCSDAPNSFKCPPRFKKLVGYFGKIFFSYALYSKFTFSEQLYYDELLTKTSLASNKLLKLWVVCPQANIFQGWKHLIFLKWWRMYNCIVNLIVFAFKYIHAYTWIVFNIHVFLKISMKWKYIFFL